MVYFSWVMLTQCSNALMKGRLKNTKHLLKPLYLFSTTVVRRLDAALCVRVTCSHVTLNCSFWGHIYTTVFDLRWLDINLNSYKADIMCLQIDILNFYTLVLLSLPDSFFLFQVFLLYSWCGEFFLYYPLEEAVNIDTWFNREGRWSAAHSQGDI